LIELYQEWEKRQNPEAHFVQAVVDSNTGLHLSEPLDHSKQLAETAAMDVELSILLLQAMPQREVKTSIWAMMTSTLRMTISST
jgi:hypothetical protein